MKTAKDSNITLDSIPVNRRMIDELFSHNLISSEAREHALRLLYPTQRTRLWVSRMLLLLGVSLILSGIIYFFAFNWTKVTPGTKLGLLQIAILASLGRAHFYKLQNVSGKIFLLSASVLIGVFLAVFGQIYQTGADAYNLFMIWALLILPWVIIAEFSGLWIVWLIISNTFLILYWNQAVLPERKTEIMIFTYLAFFNGLFLGLREYFLTKAMSWLDTPWTRVILVIPILFYTLIPTTAFIFEPSKATNSIVIGVILSVIIHLLFYFTYRFKIPDMWGLATTILSGCIILELAIYKGLSEIFNSNNALMYLIMGGLTLAVFAFAIIRLRVIANEMENRNV